MRTLSCLFIGSSFLVLVATFPTHSGQASPKKATNPPTPMATILPSETYPGQCRTWVQVNDNAFGLPSNFDDQGDLIAPTPTKAYNNEEGFEVVVFKSQLYVGMEADNIYGARLWRTIAGSPIPLDQTSWEEVAAVTDRPFENSNRQSGLLQNDHIDSLVEFNGYLYASTANGGDTEQGTLVYRSATGDSGSWAQAVTTPGFNSTKNVNFKDMQVFQGWLCGGTVNGTTGAQVWCTQDGKSWLQKNVGGFSTTVPITQNVEVSSGIVFKGALYFGVHNSGPNQNVSTDDIAKLYRTTDLGDTSPTWTNVYTGNAGTYRVDILGELDGYLYISTSGNSGIAILRSETGNRASWVQVNTSGMVNNHATNTGTVVDGATNYNGALYVGISDAWTGVEVWRTTGRIVSGNLVDWTQVDSDGLGDKHNYDTELIPFNGYLYAWTSNYHTGQQVRMTKCPVCQKRIIEGTGSYYFDAVGVTLNFISENLDEIEACLYPDAFPTGQTTELPVKRHVEINPSSGAFSATLTLSYSDAEFAASNITSENSTYLTRWDESTKTWRDCPVSNTRRDTSANSVICSGVSQLSLWAIAGSGGAPTNGDLISFHIARSESTLPHILTITAAIVGTIFLSSKLVHPIQPV